MLIAKKVPPSEYQQVEFIESTGTQWIDTGIIPSATSKLEATAQFTVDYSGIEANYLCGITGGTGRLAFGYAGTQSKTLFSVMIGGKNFKGLVYFDTAKRIFSISGDGYVRVGDVSDKYDVSEFTGQYTIPIFAARRSTGIAYYSSMKLFNYKLYDGEILLRDFIPCYRKSDNEIGLYDLVTKTFYTNQGTGEFLKGEEV